MTTAGKHYDTQRQAANDPIPAIEEVGRYIEQAENRAKSVKDIARDLAKDRAALAAQQDAVGNIPPGAMPPPDHHPGVKHSDEHPAEHQPTDHVIPPPPAMDTMQPSGGNPPEVAPHKS